MFPGKIYTFMKGCSVSAMSKTRILPTYIKDNNDKISWESKSKILQPSFITTRHGSKSVKQLNISRQPTQRPASSFPSKVITMLEIILKRIVKCNPGMISPFKVHTRRLFRVIQHKRIKKQRKQKQNKQKNIKKKKKKKKLDNTKHNYTYLKRQCFTRHFVI